MSSSASPAATVNRISSLDGLRAASIIMVVGLHTLQRIGTEHISRWWLAIFNGGTGVFLFFEISGFLITTLLLKENDRRGSVSLTGFYVRRVFRILPPLYLYIGVIILLGMAGLTQVTKIDVFGSAFFFHNFVGGRTWAFEHLWSISVEEQFYLVWPFILVFCLRTKGASARIRAAIFPAAVILISPVLRSLFYLSGNQTLHLFARNNLRYDFIMFGCLLALLQNTPRFEALYRVCTRIWWLPPATMLLCNIFSILFENYFDLTLGFTIDGFAMAIFLLWCTRNPASLLGRCLNAGPIAKIGVLSYSVYLWQTLFLNGDNQSIFVSIPWLGRLPLNWLGFIVAAAASYYLVEKPSLRLRDYVLAKYRLHRANQAARLILNP